MPSRLPPSIRDGEVEVLTVQQIDACPNLLQLKGLRDYLRKNVVALVKSKTNEQGIMTWQQWEERMSHLDHKIDKAPLRQPKKPSTVVDKPL